MSKLLRIANPPETFKPLQRDVLAFFQDPVHLRALLDILQKRYAVRVIEYFMNVYIVKHDILLTKPDGTLFDVYLEFRNRSSAFRKKNFDFFRRKEKIQLVYDFRTAGGPADRGTIVTTYPQINWYKWAIEMDLFAYIGEHYHTIKAEMAKRPATGKKLSQLLIVRSTGAPFEIQMG